MGLVEWQRSHQEDTPLPPPPQGLAPWCGGRGRSSSCRVLLGHTGSNIMGSRKPLCKMFLISLEGRKEELSINMDTGYIFRLANWTLRKQRLCREGERQGWSVVISKVPGRKGLVGGQEPWAVWSLSEPPRIVCGARSVEMDRTSLGLPVCLSACVG